MIFLNKKISSDQLFRILFIVLFFVIWLGWPFFTPSHDPKRTQFFINVLFPVSLTNIPLFFINTEYLIPQVLRKKGTTFYLLYLQIFAIVFIVGQAFMKRQLGDFRGPFVDFRSIYPVLFVLAVSTGFGLIAYMAEQDKAKQDEQKERLQSELSFLRSQISPHFIFNILNSIVYLIRSKSDSAESVTIKLSELMRYMLYESDEVQVPLSKELEYLKNYIELQKVRFEEDVEIKLSVSGNAGSQLIEPMLLIPFVENAFKHGVGMIAEPIIDIDVKCTPHSFHYVVKNKIAPETFENKDGSSGIGLKNVKRRLELLYPDAHKFSIIEENGWFNVNLDIGLKG